MGSFLLHWSTMEFFYGGPWDSTQDFHNKRMMTFCTNIRVIPTPLWSKAWSLRTSDKTLHYCSPDNSLQTKLRDLRLAQSDGNVSIYVYMEQFLSVLCGIRGFRSLVVRENSSEALHALTITAQETIINRIETRFSLQNVQKTLFQFMLHWSTMGFPPRGPWDSTQDLHKQHLMTFCTKHHHSRPRLATVLRAFGASQNGKRWKCVYVCIY